MQEERNKGQEKKQEADNNLASYILPLASKSPLRKCLVSGESHDKSELLRFVRAPDGMLTFDVNGKLPGRGAYVSVNAESLQTAIKKNLFAKSFKDKTTMPPDMAEQVTKQIRQAALQYLALARRAGDAVAGLEKCKDFANRYRLAALLLSDDAGADIRNNAARMGDEPMTPITDFNRDELGAIFGREQAVIVLLRTGGLADKFLLSSRKLAQLRAASYPGPPESSARNRPEIPARTTALLGRDDTNKTLEKPAEKA